MRSLGGGTGARSGVERGDGGDGAGRLGSWHAAGARYEGVLIAVSMSYGKMVGVSVVVGVCWLHIIRGGEGRDGNSWLGELGG